MGFFAVARLTFREVNSSLDAHKKATVNVPSVQNAIVKKEEPYYVMHSVDFRFLFFKLLNLW